jgi:hypothetical protein
MASPKRAVSDPAQVKPVSAPGDSPAEDSRSHAGPSSRWTRKPVSQILRAMIWLISVLVTAWAGAKVTEYFARPKPKVELASLTIDGYALPQTSVSLPLQYRVRLQEQVRFNPEVDNFSRGASSTISYLDQIIKDMNYSGGTINADVENLEKLLELARHPTQNDRDIHRRTLLSFWAQSALWHYFNDSLAIAVVSGSDFSSFHLADAKYGKRAAEKDLRGIESISLPYGGLYSLGSTDLFAVNSDDIQQSFNYASQTNFAPYYDLRLVAAVGNKPDDQPKPGKARLIISKENDKLHFRVFDPNGNPYEADETQHQAQVDQLTALKKKLDGRWPPHKLDPTESNEIINAAVSLLFNVNTTVPTLTSKLQPVDRLKLIWFHMDQPVLVALFTEVLSRARLAAKQHASQIEMLLALKESVNPERVHATVVISNYGSQSYIVRPVAFLRLLADPKYPYCRMHAVLYGKMTDSVPIVIEGGKSTVVDYFSEKPLKDLDAEVTSRSVPTISSLKLTNCVLYMSRATDGAQDEAFQTGIIQFGRGAGEKVAEALQAKFGVDK